MSNFTCTEIHSSSPPKSLHIFLILGNQCELCDQGPDTASSSTTQKWFLRQRQEQTLWSTTLMATIGTHWFSLWDIRFYWGQRETDGITLLSPRAWHFLLLWDWGIYCKLYCWVLSSTQCETASLGSCTYMDHTQFSSPILWNIIVFVCILISVIATV